MASNIIVERAFNSVTTAKALEHSMEQLLRAATNQRDGEALAMLVSETMQDAVALHRRAVILHKLTKALHRASAEARHG